MGRTTTDAPTTLAVAELDARGTATYRFHLAETSAPGARPGGGGRGVRVGARCRASRDARARRGPHRVRADDGSRRASRRPRSSWSTRTAAHGSSAIARPTSRGSTSSSPGPTSSRSAATISPISPGRPRTGCRRALLERGPSLVLLTDGGRVGRRRSGAASARRCPSRPCRSSTRSARVTRSAAGSWRAWIERGLGSRPTWPIAALVRDAIGVAIEVAGLTCGRAGRRSAAPGRGALAGGLTPFACYPSAP